MSAAVQSRGFTIGGWVLSGLVILFLAMDAGGKLLAPGAMIAHSPPIGLPPDEGFYRMLGAILAVCTILYAVPATAVLGAVLVTAYLGGAIAMQVRVGMPLFSNILFGVYLGLFLWGGLWFRDGRIRALLPVTR